MAETTLPPQPGPKISAPKKKGKGKGKFLILALLIIAAGWAGACFMNTDPALIASSLSSRKQIHPGELRYSLTAFGVIPVGVASITPHRIEQWHSGPVVQIVFNAQTLPAISKMYKASAMIATYADPQKVVPLLVMQEIRLKGKPPAIKEINYDPVRNTMTIGSVTRTIPADTLDPLTLLLRLKMADLSKLKEFDLNLNTNQKNYSVKGTVTSSQCVLRGSGTATLYTVKASISRRDKNPYHKSTVEMVFLKDTENIPILIKVSASGAFLAARLSEISG